MKLGEIKIEALKLMFVNYNIDMEITELPQLALDENYGSYLVNMPGSINRCFSNLEEKGVLPSVSVVLDKDDATISNGFMRFDLPTLYPNFFSIDRVVYENTNGEYNGNFDYQKEENVLVLKEISDGETYRLLYKPKIDRITAITDDNTELSIPNSIACQIPYYIKGDLYREDEANEASESRNWFESAMSELHTKQSNKTSCVKNIYSQTEN
jgi:hypothetical protein